MPKRISVDVLGTVELLLIALVLFVPISKTSAIQRDGSHAHNNGNGAGWSAGSNLNETAELIIRGTVKKVESQLRGNTVFSEAEVTVHSVHKGAKLSRVVVEYEGGEVGNTGLFVSNQPRFKQEEHVLLYLVKSRGEAFSVVGGPAGKVLLDQSGQIKKKTTAGYIYSGIHWPSSGIPVEYHVNTAGAPSGALSAAQAAAQAWNDAGSAFSFTYLGTTTRQEGNDGYNVVCWQYYDGPSGTLAVATIWYVPLSNEIVECDIRYDSSENWGTDGSPTKFDVQGIGAHEFGHWLMLDDLYDSEDSEMTMYGYASLGETKKRTLEWGDIAGIRFIYPPPRYTVTFYTNPTSVGSINADGVTKTNGMTGLYPQGSRVHVIANSASGYVFSNWETNVISVDNQLSQDTYMTVSGNGWLRAHYTSLSAITITSSPTGSGFVTVDGVAITTPQVFAWVQGSSHTLAAISPVGGGTGIQYVWLSWSDGGSQSHSIIVPSSPMTYTANFKKQYMLTVSVSPTGGGNLSVSTGWRDDGTTVPVTATPSGGYSFYYWSLDGANAGSTPSYSVLMNAPHSLTAFFRGTSSLSFGLSPESVALGDSVTLSGTLTPTQPTPGIPIGAVVALSYSLNGSTWISFITAQTGSGGAYSVVWYPPYPGSYQIKAMWSGDQNYEGVTSAVSSLTVTGAFPPRVSLLITGPTSSAKGGSAVFDVLVTNPGSSLSTTLHFEVTGPGGYRHSELQQIAVGAGEKGRFQFVWLIPSAVSAGQYQILVSLIPPKPAAIAQTQIAIT